MATSRIDILNGMLAQNPNDSFARYGLAMEYRNRGDLARAVEEFRALTAADPDYSAAYFHGGQALQRLGRIEEARQWYGRGVEVTTRKGERHALGELQAALDLLDLLG
ncbi:MAG: tetratricopeptide repeat protein [Bryobacteraceae bacterium]|jgi:tetratricopeptide (TPR) repeat protein